MKSKVFLAINIRYTVVKLVIVVVKVMFAHSYSKNSHERAKGQSYAVMKSSQT